MLKHFILVAGLALWIGSSVSARSARADEPETFVASVKLECSGSERRWVPENLLQVAQGSLLEGERFELSAQGARLEAEGTQLFLISEPNSGRRVLIGDLVPWTEPQCGLTSSMKIAPTAGVQLRLERKHLGCRPYLYWTLSSRLLHWRPHFQARLEIQSPGEIIRMRSEVALPKGTDQYGSTYKLLEMSRAQCLEFTRRWSK